MDGSACWITAKDGELPEKSLKVATDVHMETVFIARATISNSIIPGKFVKGRKEAIIPYATIENYINPYEILTDIGKLKWVSYDGTDIPPGATRAGQENGEPLYIARGQIQNVMVVGKMHVSIKTDCIKFITVVQSAFNTLTVFQHSKSRCYFPFGDREKETDKCDVLVAACNLHTPWNEN